MTEKAKAKIKLLNMELVNRDIQHAKEMENLKVTHAREMAELKVEMAHTMGERELELMKEKHDMELDLRREIQEWKKKYDEIGGFGKELEIVALKREVAHWKEKCGTLDREIAWANATLVNERMAQDNRTADMMDKVANSVVNILHGVPQQLPDNKESEGGKANGEK